MNVLDNVKRFSRVRGLSITDVARRANVSASGVYRWDKSEPNAASVKAVADVLGVDPGELTGASNDHVNDQVSGLDLKEAIASESPLYWGRRKLDDIDRVALSRLLNH